ncbi:MAG TPA: 2-oxoacid:acceptor oxidoreductase family protein [Candidatus Aminicenantes bacterium]|nr:2-oxoacid:acceptor oxidoreductase family protein [Candidatus Aminicenantes bacterium]
MKTYEIRYGAVGGQGIITAGALLVDIAVEKENRHALESPTYTAAVRGGPTKVDVIVSDEPIIFPHATAIDFFLCTDQRPYNLYKERLKDDAIVVVDSHLVRELGDTRNWKIYQIPLINETKKQVGNVVLTSVVSLAITQKLTQVVEYENMVEFIKHWAPKNALEMNIKAIEVGRSLVS